MFNNCLFGLNMLKNYTCCLKQMLQFQNRKYSSVKSIQIPFNCPQQSLHLGFYHTRFTPQNFFYVSSRPQKNFGLFQFTLHVFIKLSLFFTIGVVVSILGSDQAVKDETEQHQGKSVKWQNDSRQHAFEAQTH